MSISNGTPSAIADPLLPDSIFTWVFEANSGNRWGGWLVANSADFDVGAIRSTALGRYVITAEQERGIDLSPSGLEDNEVHVEWYRSAAGQFLVTRGGSGVVAGSNGLGSELDAAWTADGWVSFGQGGSQQVNLPANARYNWVFEATTGDRIFGTLVADSQDYAVGQRISNAFGAYRITGVEAFSASDPAENVAGLVRITRYYDSSPGRDLALEGGGNQVNGTGGLGSEVERVWTGRGWTQVGLGGSLQANADFSMYRWRFEATSGDRYNGWLFDATSAFDPGDTLAGAAGRYVIETEAVRGPANSYAPGTVWIDTYYDAQSGQTMQAWYWHKRAQPTPLKGLGNEHDWVWDGDNWDEIGRGGQLQSDVETYSMYRWRFEATSGDRYHGWLFDASTAFNAGDTLAGAAGRYVIETEAVRDGVQAWAAGTVWIDTYFDALSGQTMKAWYWHTARRATPLTGLGNEHDWVWDGDNWDQIGRGGQLQSDVETYSMYRWRFEADSGDRYNGWLFDLSTAFDPGDTLARTAGRYVIETEVVRGAVRSWADGTIWIDTYFDALSGQTMQAWYWHRRGQPTPLTGFGNEHDWVWDGDNWDEIGRAGQLQSDVEPFG